MSKKIFTILTFLLLFILSGCGSNSKPDGNPEKQSETVAVEMQNKYIVQDESGIDFTLAIPITKKLDSSYLVKLSKYDLTVEGCSMSTTPSYAPATLTLDGGLNSVETLYVTGTFDQNCTVNGYTFTATQTVTKGSNVDTRAFSAAFDYSNPEGSGGETSPATDGYSFYNATTPLTISQANTAYTIKVQLLKDGFVSSGKEVQLKPFSRTYGGVANYKVTTGSDGYANFDYTSPAILPANGTSTSIEVVYIDENNATIKENLVLSFNISGGGGGVNPYNLVNPSTPIEVTGGNQDHNIIAYVVDASTDVGVGGKTVTITTIANGYGSVNTATATTDAAGKVEFIYTSPSSIAGLTSTTAKMRFTEDGITSEQEVDIHFTTPAGGGNQYSLMNETTPISITDGDQIETISVYVVDSTSGVGVSGKNVTLSTPSFGTLTSSTATTNAAGLAQFTYQAPNDLTGLTTTAMTLSFTEEGVTLNALVTINVTPSSNYALTNVTTPIIVNYNDEFKTISVDVIDQNGVGVEGANVSISVVNGVEHGSIISASTIKSDISGHALFTYKAPADVAAVDGKITNVTLSMVSNGVKVTEAVSIGFKKVDVNISVPIVVITDFYKDVNLTENSQNAKMEVQVLEQSTNTPYGTGNVKVSLPDNILTGTDVGSFAEYTVAVGSNGKAVFNYTGPQDIQSLIDANETNATFGFSHELNPTQKENITVMYDSSVGYIPANYILNTSSPDGNQTMGLQMSKTFALHLEDDQGTKVEGTKITQIIIESKNTLIGKLVNTADGGAHDETLIFNESDAVNGKSFTVQTYTLSGLLPIEITVTFNDANGDTQTMTAIMNIVVFSGPPTAMSISYAGVEQNISIAKYIEKFALTVTDAYNNPVNTQPYVAVGAMVEYAVDGSSASGERTTTSPRLWHGLNDPLGELEAIGGNKAQFTTTSDAFNHVDIANDKLVVFGAGYVYEALGKWDIDSVANQLLGLKDDYNGTTRSNLFFAVGHNNRQDLCSAGNEFVGNMKANNYQLNESGHALIEFEYDYHLTGKDIMVWANLTGYQADSDNIGRIGEAKKHTLRGNGFISSESWLVPAGSSAHKLSFSVEHENAPEKYRNGHFGFAVTGKCAVHGILDWSNNHDARDCNNTVGYVDLNVSNPSSDDCTIEIDRINVSSEFNGIIYP